MTNWHELLGRLNQGLCTLKGVGVVDVATHTGADLAFTEWEWEIGVGVYGLYQYAIYTGNEASLQALERWFDTQILRGLPSPQINNTTPMLTLAFLAEQRDRQDWYARIDRWAQELIDSLPRVNGGGFQHVVKERANSGQLWDDTLFMTGLFLAKAGQVLNRGDYLHEAELQFLSHAQYLTDSHTGLWFHGWSALGRHHFADALWARGNAWITVAIPELIAICGTALNPAVKQHLVSLLNLQITALMSCQNPDGTWPTLLDDAVAPAESSATAGFAYGMLRACRLQLIPAEQICRVRQAALAAVDAVVERIDSQGLLQGASGGTAMGHDRQFYFDIPYQPVPYGQALAMLCITEVIQGEWMEL